MKNIPTKIPILTQNTDTDRPSFIVDYIVLLTMTKSDVTIYFFFIFLYFHKNRPYAKFNFCTDANSHLLPAYNPPAEDPSDEYYPLLIYYILFRIYYFILFYAFY